ncbi:VOC family protein [Labrenzia sp. 011]|uniref:VOC family protein n=1 Tax=Labrenzia sp. 011 TaxID=2171494 RepID=UPI001AD8B5EF|nr:VOC family protein [Labrenzia sp. 011]
MAPLTRVILYVKDVERSAAFYALHFGFSVQRSPSDRITELVPADGGTRLLLHKAGKAQKLGQVAVKLVFDVKDISGFCEMAKSHGLVFGSPHQADGYQFANAKDPDGNSLQVSSRACRQMATD